jgi:outer membrane protein assembly factor BamE (lipoprotein component of BamABCDE complex)
MKATLTLVISAFLLVGYSTGCSSSGGSGAQAMATTIPSSSPLSKIKVGMSRGEVESLIGPPTYAGTYTTGKQFIPFHFSGSDVVRTGLHYKGQGIVILSNDSAYSSGSHVCEVQYDPTEPGYDR